MRYQVLVFIIFGQSCLFVFAKPGPFQIDSFRYKIKYLLDKDIAIIYEIEKMHHISFLKLILNRMLTHTCNMSYYTRNTQIA